MKLLQDTYRVRDAGDMEHFLILSHNTYLIEYIMELINAVIYWLEGYLALFTIASMKPMYPELNNNNYEVYTL